MGASTDSEESLLYSFNPERHVPAEPAALDRPVRRPAGPARAVAPPRQLDGAPLDRFRAHRLR